MTSSRSARLLPSLALLLAVGGGCTPPRPAPTAASPSAVASAAADVVASGAPAAAASAAAAVVATPTPAALASPTPAPTPSPTPVAAAYVVTTFAGGVSGFMDAQGGAAAFDTPRAVAADAHGRLLVADAGNNRIRTLTSEGLVGTLAGGADGTSPVGTQHAPSSDGPGFKARFSDPGAIAIDAQGNAFVADRDTHKIRVVALDGVVSTLAGEGEGDTEGQGSGAKFRGPSGLAVDAAGNLYVADTDNHRLKVVSKGGHVTDLAGSGTIGFNDGAGRAAGFQFPHGLALGPDGALYVADEGNHRIRRVDLSNAEHDVSTFSGSFKGQADGPAASATFDAPTGLALGPDGALYVVEGGGCRVRRIDMKDPAHPVTTLAGNGLGFADGPGPDARFSKPEGLAVGPDGTLYVADTGNHRVRALKRAAP